VEHCLYEIMVGVIIIAGCALGWVVVSMALLIRIARALENLKVNATSTSIGCPSCGSWHAIDAGAGNEYKSTDGSPIDNLDKGNSDGS